MTGPDPSDLRSIVDGACTAASLHNTQPWLWVARPDRLELWADWSRRLPGTDHLGRELMVSCGAALHTATVVAAAQGWSTSVRRLPDPAQPALLASVTFSRSVPSPAQTELADAVHRRRTDRRQVSSWAVPPERVERLREVARAHGVLATAALDDVGTGLVRHVLAAARHLQGRDATCADELSTWTRTAAPEGVPAENLPAADVQQRLGEGLSRFPAGTLADDYREAGSPAPTWMVLSTSSDDPDSWLRAGEALAALWLTCTAGGLCLLPLSQAIEVPVTRRALQDGLLDDVAFPQIVLRIGWPPLSRDVVPPTQRRPLEQVLSFAPSGDRARVGRSQELVACGRPAATVTGWPSPRPSSWRTPPSS